MSNTNAPDIGVQTEGRIRPASDVACETKPARAADGKAANTNNLKNDDLKKTEDAV